MPEILFCPEAWGGSQFQNLNDLKLKKANDDRIAARQLAAAKELGAKLDDSSVTLTIKAGEGGRAFGSVSSRNRQGHWGPAGN